MKAGKKACFHFHNEVFFFLKIHCNLKNIKINNNDYFNFKKRTAEMYNYFTVLHVSVSFITNE